MVKMVSRNFCSRPKQIGCGTSRNTWREIFTRSSQKITREIKWGVLSTSNKLVTCAFSYCSSQFLTEDAVRHAPLSFPFSIRRARNTRYARARDSTRNGIAASIDVSFDDKGAAEDEIIYERSFGADGVQTTVTRENGFYCVCIQMEDSAGWTLHWGIEDWKAPNEECWPKETIKVDDKAVETSFPLDGSSIRIAFEEASSPSKVVFVLKRGEIWKNNEGQNFLVVLKPPGVQDLEDRIIDAEARFERWSLFNRIGMASQVVDEAVALGPEAMALVFTWLRLSALRQLDWYRGSNYQAKDAAHAQKVLADRLVHVVRTTSEPLVRLFARECLAVLPRGGGNGDDIRHGILNLMRENGIREGHRPGISDKFLESWHQKLHTNTTPEDIAICEAYLAFLRSGSMDDFWRVLWDVGRLTPEDLATMDHPIEACPCHLPHMIPGFEHYLWILKRTHSGADLDVAFSMCRGLIDDDLAWHIGDFLANRDAWWVPGKIVEIRQRLKQYWNSENATRDLMYLDIALDSYFRLCIERMDKGAMQADDLLNLAVLVLENAAIALDCDEILQSFNLIRRIANGEPQGRWSGRTWGMAAYAATDFVNLSLEAYADRIVEMVQPYAYRFGKECSIDPSFIVNFAEEVVRGQSVFILGILLKFLVPALQESAGVDRWQIVSQGMLTAGNPIEGTVKVLKNLEPLQGKPPKLPTVVIVETLTGNEDIPENIVAVITGSGTDVLSHVAIRARSQNVLLASCFDIEAFQAMKDDFNGDLVQLRLESSGGVTATPITSESVDLNFKSNKDQSVRSVQAKLNLIKPFGLDNFVEVMNDPGAVGRSMPWVLTESEFEPNMVGAKAMNLKSLRAKLPDSIGVPLSIALPFGTFERILSYPGLNDVAEKNIKTLQRRLESQKNNEGVPHELKELRAIVRRQLEAPDPLKRSILDYMKENGIFTSSSSADRSWNLLWSSICAVWASKWNSRAWLSRCAQGISEDDLYMGVLLQNMIPARYAFVLHTADVLTGERGKVHGELVVGMGEALVGNFPGRALSFTVGVDNTPLVMGLPSKREQLTPSPDGDSIPTGCDLNIMIRSDSNGEDLGNFAGAGLYSSVPLVPFQRKAVEYWNESIFWDEEERQVLLREIIKSGIVIDELFDSPQDIEGVIDCDGQISIVQARPQVQ